MSKPKIIEGLNFGQVVSKLINYDSNFIRDVFACSNIVESDKCEELDKHSDISETLETGIFAIYPTIRNKVYGLLNSCSDD